MDLKNGESEGISYSVNNLIANNKANAVYDFLTDNFLITLNNGKPTHLNYSISKAIDITATNNI